jgi:hypothetical protein
VKLERPPSATTLGRAATAVAALAGGVVGAALAGAPAAAALGLASGALAAAGDRHLSRRYLRRRRLLATPFPERWREFLLDRYDHFERLPDELRARFEDDLRIFVFETRVTGVGVGVTDELKLLVGASAVTLSAGWPDYEWEQLTEVLLYPQDFDRDYGFEQDELAGQTHPWGTVILSVPALEQSFEDPDDGFHVGLHEFAHLLDVHQTHFDGIPPGLDAARSREWVALMEKEMERLRRGKSALDPYGAEDPVEFLAVAIETFFEAPLAMRKRHREVYAILSAYFHQDPAAWDDERGLVLE